MNPLRPCLALALLVPALASAAETTCAELGQRYTMYTYKAGDRVGVNPAAATRSFMVWLDCKYPADAKIDLGFGARLCPGETVKVGNNSCKVSKVDSLTAKPPIDPDGSLVTRNSGNRARPPMK